MELAMARRKTKPWKPPIAGSADVGFVEVDNPHRERVPLLARKRTELAYHEDTVTVARALRDDPLARLHHHHQISDGDFRAGREWQRIFELSRLGRLRSPGDIKEHVDGTPPHPDPINPRQQAAQKRLTALDAILGRVGAIIVREVLGDGLNFKQVAAKHEGAGSRPYEEWIGKRFRECLTTLAKELGYGG